ncbi:MAG: hypothetical protein II026_05770 [Bacteroidales bacterium]|nr:hypothetical protein [Bacteroidales bacterium]
MSDILHAKFEKFFQNGVFPYPIVLISAAKVEGFPQPTVINISGDFDDYSECAKFVGYEPLQFGSKEISQEALA